MFYSQQAAEKAFKAFLSAYDHPFPRTHDLDRLLQWCAEIENRFTMFEDPARILTPYAVEFRYPSGRMEPEESEALEAVRLAAGIVAFVSQRLSSIDPEAGT